MKHSIRLRILFIFILVLSIIFISLLCYANFYMRPDSMRTAQQQAMLLAEAKSSEVNTWIHRKIDEFRILSSMPAFKSLDIRALVPLIANLTDSYRSGSNTMETFAYGSNNGYSGFNWINADAILDLIKHSDYDDVITGAVPYSISAPAITKGNQEVMLFYYPIKGYDGDVDGLLCSAVPTVRLKEIVNPMQIYNGKSWIIDQNGSILTTSRSYFHQRVLSQEELNRFFDTQKLTTSGNMTVKTTTNGEGTLFFVPINYSPGWVFCMLVDNNEIYISANKIVWGLSGICLLLLGFSIFIGMKLAQSVVNPIRSLQHQMNLVERGNLTAYYTPTTRDEILYLGRSYNAMLDEINRLIACIYKEQESKRKAELDVLQAQIKPHFLYNTLDNLKWMAKEHGIEDVAQAITNLSTFFRVQLSNGQEEITLKEEFRHTSSYLNLQHIRYSHHFTYTIDLPDSLANFMIIKIVIQPIVENSIYHGIKPKNGPGHIHVAAYDHKANIQITVEDNGVGIEAERLTILRKSLVSNTGAGHYGLLSIRQRISLAYGDNADLIIESASGKGTRITIIIPKMERVLCTEQL